MQAPQASSRIWRPALVAVALLAAIGSTAFARSGNYLIIVADVFDGTTPMTEFVNAKTAQGLDVTTHSVVGGTSKEAIKDYIEGLWGTPDAPDYVLLVGDTDTIPCWTGEGTKHAATDLYYACMDGPEDWYPDIFIGRFAVRTESQLQAVVDKTLFVEAGTFSDPDYVKRAAFLATDDQDAQAEETHDWVIANYLDPAGYVSTRIYPDEQGTYPDGGDGTVDITNAVNNGSLLVVYMGHSTALDWWAPHFNRDDIRALSNVGLYGLVVGFSCHTALFVNSECFGETWIREADKGAAAYLSATNFIYYLSVEAWESSRVLEKFFFESFFVDDIWEVSPAWQAALWRFRDYYGPEHEYTRNFFEEFVLLGDPSLLLPQPPGFSLSPDPVARDLCAPDDVTTYSIEVQQRGGFEGSVTLTASGEPPGSQVEFSLNSLPPPFTTVMTVSNIPIGSPSQSSIEVTGTATGAMQKSVVVRLSVSTSPPGAVTLTSPPNGQLDVSRTPTLSWQPATQGVQYDIEVATDSGFTEVIYSVTETETSHVVGVYFDPVTLYYWHVRAVNGCGQSDFSPTFSFTTVDQLDYFTEEFTPPAYHDLDNFTIAFIPDGSGDYYEACTGTIDELPTDPTGGTVLNIGEDASLIVLPYYEVHLYSDSYLWFFVNDNGNITFNGGDDTYEESPEVHFNQPRISGLFDDLSVPSGGTVSWKETDDRIAVTFENVPEYNTSNSNTFQMELFFNGEIHLSWLECDSDDSIVGLSEGLGLPSDFIPGDFSEVPRCVTPGDLNCDGLINGFDIDPFVLALTAPATYESTYPNCNIDNADCNADGYVNGFDIDPFVELLTGG